MARVVVINDFDSDDRDITATVVQTTADFIKRAESNINKVLIEERDKFFQRMIQKGFDISGPPDLDEFTPDWPPYSDKYRRWKEKKKPGRGFFLLTGALKRSLSSGAAASSVLGKPQVLIDEVDVIRRIKGKRVPRVKYEFTVLAAPRLGNLRDHSLHAKLNGKLRATRLTHVRGRITRPLFEPFLNWWLNYVVQPRVAKVLAR
jgi:hypothetical protein